MTVTGDTVGPRVLVVQPRDLPAVTLSANARNLAYAFTHRDTYDGFSAWRAADHTSASVLEVQAECALRDGSYRRNALNRWFAQEVMAIRPVLVLLRGTAGCVLDLLRIARLLRVPALLDTLDESLEQDPHSVWLSDCLGAADAIVSSAPPPEWLDDVAKVPWHTGGDPLAELERTLVEAAAIESPRFSYACYEFLQRDQPLLMRMQQGDVSHFEGAQRVLDLGCGAGLFLQLLEEKGVMAVGVERNPDIADYGRGTGLDIVTGDALDYVEQASGFDGIYCSHFIEHLPVEAAQRLLAGIASALQPGGVAVLVFPDPESIRSQLLGFWRDPEHVRFYHPELVIAMAAMEGLQLDWTSHEHPFHSVISFPMEPEPLPAMPAETRCEDGSDDWPATWWQRLLASFGLASRSEVAQLKARLARQDAAFSGLDRGVRKQLNALTERTEQLWAVNQTWSWPDNAVLRFRKQSLGG